MKASTAYKKASKKVCGPYKAGFGQYTWTWFDPSKNMWIGTPNRNYWAARTSACEERISQACELLGIDYQDREDPSQPPVDFLELLVSKA